MISQRNLRLPPPPPLRPHPSPLPLNWKRLSKTCTRRSRRWSGSWSFSNFKKSTSRTNKRTSRGSFCERKKRLNVSSRCPWSLASSLSPLTTRRASSRRPPAPIMWRASWAHWTASCWSQTLPLPFIATPMLLWMCSPQKQTLQFPCCLTAKGQMLRTKVSKTCSLLPHPSHSHSPV